MQIIAKIVVTIATLLFVGWGLYRFWLIDIDLGKLLSPMYYFESSKRSLEEKFALIPQREANALYQNRERVAKVEGVGFDPTKKLCSFDKIFEAYKFDIDDPFEYRDWILKCKSADTMTMNTFTANGLNEGRTFTMVQCEILGKR